jgi:hypothetical protein
MKMLAVLRRAGHQLDDDGDTCLAYLRRAGILLTSVSPKRMATSSGLKLTQMSSAPLHFFARTVFKCRNIRAEGESKCPGAVILENNARPLPRCERPRARHELLVLLSHRAPILSCGAWRRESPIRQYDEPNRYVSTPTRWFYYLLDNYSIGLLC